MGDPRRSPVTARTRRRPDQARRLAVQLNEPEFCKKRDGVSASATRPSRSKGKELTVLPKIKAAWIVLLVIGVAIGIVFSGNLCLQTQAQESEQSKDYFPM